MPIAGSAVQRFAQRHISKRAWRTINNPSGYSVHADNFQGGTALEFGSGRDLLAPLLLSAAGATSIYTYDVDRLATVEYVNHIITQLRSNTPGDWPEVRNLADDLVRHYRIHYIAPGDARRTGLANGSVDFFCSTSTLEHIPEPSIRSILAECLRVASKRAVFSFVIDYKDHYAAADKRISPFNFYRYSDQVWRWFNPPNHYQNRLRHSDFEHLFREMGFEVESRRVMRDLPEMPLADRFGGYSREDLSTGSGFFVMHAQRN